VLLALDHRVEPRIRKTTALSFGEDMAKSISCTRNWAALEEPRQLGTEKLEVTS
jgi:hypothetical protein